MALTTDRVKDDLALNSPGDFEVMFVGDYYPRQEEFNRWFCLQTPVFLHTRQPSATTIYVALGTAVVNI